MEQVRRPNPTLSGSKYVSRDRKVQELPAKKLTRVAEADAATDESAVESFITSESQKQIGKTRKSPAKDPSKSQVNFRISTLTKNGMSSRELPQTSRKVDGGMLDSKVSLKSSIQKPGNIRFTQNSVR